MDGILIGFCSQATIINSIPEFTAEKTDSTKKLPGNKKHLPGKEIQLAKMTSFDDILDLTAVVF